MNLVEFCDHFQSLMERSPETPLLGEASKQLVKDLLKDPTWFGEHLQKFIADPAFLSNEPSSVFDNEVKLYRSPNKSFTVLSYIWDSPILSPVHDHSSWGIIGSLLRPLREIKYQRLDNKEVEGYAELKLTSDFLIPLGEVGTVLPLDKGIHQTGSADNQFTITFGVYGKSIRKGYILFFDPAAKKVTPTSQRLPFRRALALQALVSLGEALGKRFLTPELVKSLPEDLIQEFRGISSIPDTYRK